MTAMSLMDYDAVTLGHRELELDFKILDDQIAINHTPVICSNLLLDGVSYGQKYVLTQRDSVTIGIVSAFGPTQGTSQDRQTDSPWTFGDVESALPSVMEELESRSNILILLSQMGLWKTLELIDDFPQIDVAVVGDEGKTIRNPILYRNSLVVMSGNRGQYVGKLDLTFDQDGGMLSYFGDLIPLNETVQDNPEIAALVAEFKNRVEDLAADSAYSVAGRSETGGTSPQGYVGASACQDCHSWIYTKWQVTPHRHAFQVLYQERQHANPECIPCHVVGYGQGGYIDIATTPRLTDVQCENCHGKGSSHAANPQTATSEVVSESACLTCHCGKWGDDFDYSTAVKSVH